MSLEIFSLRQRPDLVAAVFADEFDGIWPAYMHHDAAARLYFREPNFNHYLDYAFAGLMDGEVVGRAFSVPFAFGIEGRSELPDGGWDEVIRWSHEDRLLGRPPSTMSALEISLLPRMRGGGHSLALLDVFKTRARTMGFAEVYAPVRPNQKHLRPRMPMRDYVVQKRPDGLPIDAWLRTHVTAGGRIVKIAPCSMTVVGTIAEWAQWTGTAFRRSGEAEVEGALAPVLVSLEQDHAVYVEPNVWVRHPV